MGETRARRSGRAAWPTIRSRGRHIRLSALAALAGLLLLGQLPAAASAGAAPAPLTAAQAPTPPSDAPPVAQATSPTAQMTVRAGFDGIGKVGGWMPIEVELRNDGPDLNGEIQIVVTDTNTNANRGTYTRAPAVYTTPAVLPRRSHKRLTLEAELRATGQRIQARLMDGTTIVSEQDVSLARVAAGELLCGVLSRSGTAFDGLQSLELPPPLRRARIAHLEVSDLPNRPQLLASLDCLIFENISTAAMLQNQKDALAGWVSSGGLLIVVGGPTWQKTMSALPPELLPVKPTGLTSMSSLAALGDLSHEAIPDAGPWLVSQATLTDGNAVVEQDGVPVIAAARRGNGTVMYLGVDPTLEPLRSWPGIGALWRYILAHGSGGVGLSSASSSFVSWGRPPRNAMVDISTLGSPATGWLMAALGLYALIVGPLNYLVLRRIGRPTWSLATIPLITLIASIGTFSIAGSGRESDSILNKVTLLRGSPHAPAYGRTYVSMLSRQPQLYDVRAGETALISSLFYPFPRDPSGEAQGWSLRVAGGPAPAVNNLQLQAGTLGTFVVDSQVNLPGRLESDLRLEGRQLVGTITNGLGAPLYDASLILDYQVTRVGDFKAGETREVTVNLGAAASAGYGPPTSFASLLYPTSGGARRQGDPARRDILDSAFGSSYQLSRLELSGPTLMGWLDMAPVELDVRGARPAQLDNSLFISSLAVGLPRGYEGELPAPIVSHRQLGAASQARQQFGSYSLANGESLGLQFSLPIGNGRFLVDGVYVNIDGRPRGVAAAALPLGEVALYNWRSAEWDERIVSFGRNLVKDAAPYVSAAGDVRVRYTFKPPPDVGATGVEFSRFDVTASGLMR